MFLVWKTIQGQVPLPFSHFNFSFLKLLLAVYRHKIISHVIHCLFLISFRHWVRGRRTPWTGWQSITWNARTHARLTCMSLNSGRKDLRKGVSQESSPETSSEKECECASTTSNTTWTRSWGWNPHFTRSLHFGKCCLHCILYRLLVSFFDSRLEWASFLAWTLSLLNDNLLHRNKMKAGLTKAQRKHRELPCLCINKADLTDRNSKMDNVLSFHMENMHVV